MGPRLIFRLHLAVHAVLLTSYLILLVLFNFLELLVKDNIVFKLVLVLFEKRVLHNI